LGGVNHGNIWYNNKHKFEQPIEYNNSGNIFKNDILYILLEAYGVGYVKK